MARIVKDPKDRKISMTFSIPLYIVNWFDKLKKESPGFNKNKLVIDVVDNYMKNRGDL